MVYADANILIRYIINDNETMAQKADEAINSRTLFVLPEVFAEIVYVLTKVYGIERTDVADSMLELLDFVSTTEPEIMKTAFQNYRETKLDFVDCILAAHAISDYQQILSFDKKLNNFIARKKAESSL
ncbi:MAG: PIN domain-containing protein [Treponema sp.]|uniref:PIN domain-containing protein n=1 Tax=Treponema sp. TaxID=166 RepID=UPI0025D705CD|nr:PIN domain-containing protein [Treponema sp.]MBQ8678904.1 PIN domain-containing protein [Treponema sp.]MBR1615004.1 PIN domain-containing protein [Treponema sp.]